MKYTKEYKKKLVEKYLKSKESLMGFTRNNEIPKSTFQELIKTYNKYGPDAYTDSHTRKIYTLQEKTNLVELYLKEDTTLTEFSKSHGIPPMTFETWLSKYYNSHLPNFLRRGNVDLSKKKTQFPKFKNDKERADYLEKEFRKQEEIIEEQTIKIEYLKELRRLRLKDPKMQHLSTKQELPKASEEHTN